MGSNNSTLLLGEPVRRSDISNFNFLRLKGTKNRAVYWEDKTDDKNSITYENLSPKKLPKTDDRILFVHIYRVVLIVLFTALAALYLTLVSDWVAATFEF